MSKKLLIAALFFMFSKNTFCGGNSRDLTLNEENQDRLEQLEKKINNLEERLAKIEMIFSNTSASLKILTKE